MRDEVVDFVTDLTVRTKLSQRRLVGWLGIARSKFYEWKQRYGRVNEHNGRVPRDFLVFGGGTGGYHRLLRAAPGGGVSSTDVHDDGQRIWWLVSASKVYRTLKQEGPLGRRAVNPSKKGTGFVQPTRPHQEWPIEVTYVNLSGTFYYLCSVLDGFSRYIVPSWELREARKERDVELNCAEGAGSLSRQKVQAHQRQ